MRRFVETARSASTLSEERALGRLSLVYGKDAIHYDPVFELRGPAELSGFAAVVGKSKDFRMDRLAPAGSVHRTRYRYRLVGGVQVDHVMGTEHVIREGLVHLQREFMNLDHWAANIPGGRLVLGTSVGRFAFRLFANWTVQKQLEAQGSVGRRGVFARGRVALDRARSVGRRYRGINANAEWRTKVGTRAAHEAPKPPRRVR